MTSTSWPGDCELTERDPPVSDCHLCIIEITGTHHHTVDCTKLLGAHTQVLTVTMQALVPAEPPLLLSVWIFPAGLLWSVYLKTETHTDPHNFPVLLCLKSSPYQISPTDQTPHCRSDTPGKREPWLGNCLHPTGTWPWLWGHSLANGCSPL